MELSRNVEEWQTLLFCNVSSYDNAKESAVVEYMAGKQMQEIAC